MLPQPDDFPALLAEQSAVQRISFSVALDLGFPFLGQLVAPLLEPPAVPEVAVNEYNQFYGPEHEIRTARKIAGVTLPFEANAGECAREQKLRSGVATANPTHHSRAGFPRHDVAPMLSWAPCAWRVVLPSNVGGLSQGSPVNG